MSEKKADYQALRQTLDGILGASTPDSGERREAQPASFTINGGTVIIQTGAQSAVHLPASPSKPDAICGNRANWIKQQVAEIARLESERNPNFSEAHVWRELCDALGVLHCEDIAMADCDQAKKLLDRWLTSFQPSR